MTPAKIARCPTCGKPLGTKPIRICYKCKQPIAVHHKYTLIESGEYTYKFQHRNCDKPESYS